MVIIEVSEKEDSGCRTPTPITPQDTADCIHWCFSSHPTRSQWGQEDFKHFKVVFCIHLLIFSNKKTPTLIWMENIFQKILLGDNTWAMVSLYMTFLLSHTHFLVLPRHWKRVSFQAVFSNEPSMKLNTVSRRPVTYLLPSKIYAIYAI